MFGDFEAQRHWMEITYNLPVKEWYINTNNNDLLYWGLDYPPLTAYHSYLMGLVANHFNSSWIALASSRGLENVHHKLFMRLTAILPFHLIYAPSMIYFVFYLTKRKGTPMNLMLAVILMYPGLLAIDNAHFQYNSVSLGLFLWSFLFLANHRISFGSIFFVLAVNYKQMELYHALPIFTFIFSRCLKKPFKLHIIESVFTLLKVSIVVVSLFTLLWIPFIINGQQTVLAVLRRIFPFYRGLYEDKVASVWCSFSFLLRMNDHFSLDTQAVIVECIPTSSHYSAACVILAVLPSLCLLFLRPTVKNFKSSLIISSLVFSYFHSKCTRNLYFWQLYQLCYCYQSIAMQFFGSLIFQTQGSKSINGTIIIFSMFSLCLKDSNSLILAAFIAYYVTCSTFVEFSGKKLLMAYHLSCLAAVAICILEWAIPPPARYPHIFPLLNALYSCVHFLGFLVYFYFEMVCYEYRVLVGRSM
ncbi:ALG6, ALG8 glycosyltransferase family protein [Dictyocaulus viviparus]|uniref:Alpha-1,3-glucosyltransferase n=1 Tax=Dictyocaulus viviparus TaxID=29172 RepID=A0A0D8XR92_DICVI|nr:ALG6, ALG8 glycosyltransferase family protein [Dictyocaulus viviparus]